MILRTDKRTYLIMGAGFALVMALLSFCTSDLGIVYNLVSGLLVGALYGGIMLFMDKHQENKAYYCRHKVESAQEVICQGSAAIRKSSFGFNTSGWMFLGNTSLDYYKITAASGEKAMEINLSDIVSTTVSRNLLTIKTDVQAVTLAWERQTNGKNRLSKPLNRQI